MTTRIRRGSVALLAAVLAAAAPLAAQTPTPGGPPPEAAAELFAFFNLPSTIRMMGETRIARDAEITGDLAVLGGPLHLAGRIRGRVVVLNGSARLEPGAEVDGDLTVVGGTVSGLDSARVDGVVVVYREPLRYRLVGDRIVAATPEPEPGFSTGREFGFGRTDVTVTSHRGYNRVEGLPIVAGPRFETRAANPTRAEALLIYRTETGVDLDARDFGYRLRLEQFVGGARSVRLGAALYSEIVPIEAWGLRDRENALATFLLRRDYRDHYERAGWTGYVRIAPPGGRYDVALGYADEEHASVPPADPWTLFGGDAWRPQPQVAEGRLRTLFAHVGYDTRNDALDPTTGWWIRAEVERAIDGTLRHMAVLPCPGGDCASVAPTAVPVESEFAVGFLDLRRYARISPTSRIALRVVAATSLNDRPLPPQRQHVLGGEGSLPGYGRFQFDCGARGTPSLPNGLLAYYGCDRLALVQLEYRSVFPFLRGWGRKLGWDIDLGETPGWVVFFDAGRAWNERVARGNRTEGQDDFAADVGAGFRLGHIGIYWAVPLSGRDERLNFFVRIGSRF